MSQDRPTPQERPASRLPLFLLIALALLVAWVHLAADQKAAAQLARGDERYLAEEYPLALPHYQAAAQLDPDNFRAHQRLGRTLQHLEKHEEAGQAYRRALELNPNHVETLVCYIEHLLLVKDLPAARAQLRHVLSLQPICFEALDQMSRAEEMAGRPDRAAFWCKKILEYRPHYYSAEYRLAQLALAAGRPEETLERVQHTYGIALPWDQMALDLSVVAHLRLGQPDQALEQLARQTRRQVLSPQARARVHFSVALYFKRQGLAERAQQQLDEGLKLVPTGPLAERAKQMIEGTP